ncbi:Protein of unknown function [Bosea sp. CRIB-10]|nr:Protein of unknown function [Bosea sp. CRIB-10]
MNMSDNRLSAPSALRNRDPILAVLREALPASGTVLEIASGSGEHVIHFAKALPGLSFQPSDPAESAMASIAAWSEESGLLSILPPLQLDATAPWPVDAADAIICINMIHIAPWAAAQGLFAEAARILPPDSPLFLYGPYRRPGRPLEASNLAFDESLKARDPAWGLRDLDAVTTLAEATGFAEPEVTEMPANNLALVFRRRRVRD